MEKSHSTAYLSFRIAAGFLEVDVPKELCRFPQNAAAFRRAACIIRAAEQYIQTI